MGLLFTQQVVLPRLGYINDAITWRSLRNDRTSRKVMCVREVNDLVGHDHADSKFSLTQLEAAHPLLPEGNGQFFRLSRPP